MKNYFFTMVIFAGMLFACSPGNETKEAANEFIYPETKKVDTVDVYFGQEVPDPYRWLEDDNSDETAAWVKAQNEVTFKYLEGVPFRQKIIDRLTEIWNYEKYSTPFYKGGNYFFFKNDGLQNQSVMYVQSTPESEARVLLDPNKLSEDGTKALSGVAISKDGKYMLYGVSTGGSDWKELFVRNIETGEDLQDHIEWVKFSSLGWHGNGFFYSAYDPPAEDEALQQKNEYHKLYYHTLGTPQSEDELIYEMPEHPNRIVYGGTTDDEKFLVISESEASSTSMLHVKDLTKPNAKLVTLEETFDYQHAVIENIDNHLLLLTNYEAPRYRLVSVDLTQPAKANWKELIPEKDDVLESVEMCNGKLVAVYMHDAHSKVEVYDMEGNFEHNVELPAMGSVGSFNGRKNDATAFFSFTSFTYPTTIYKYDIETNTQEVFRQPGIDFNIENYETKQVFYTSKDGTKIPMFIVHKRGIELNGQNPTLLYGYGGFNVSLTPRFRISLLPWLENGGVYAMANLRGGGEYGKEWHEAGKQLNKQNVFDDFIAAAEYLIDEKYTSSQKLAIQGGSNGGLLVGAVTNQRPDLFAVAIPEVGVMDMLRFHKFTIGWAWVGDYGSSDNEEQFRYIYKYSPLHNISSETEYPAVLVTTADHDDRVVPAHSFKYIATLQEKYKGENPVMIRIETMAGHGAGKPTSKIIQEAADIWAFTFHNMNETPYATEK